MNHLLAKDFVSENVPVQFIVTLFVFVFCTSSFLVFPSVKHFRWKVIYLIKVLYCTMNITTLLSVLWWLEWLCGEVLCLDHQTAYSRSPVPARVSVHVGLNALKLLYTTDLNNDTFQYRSIVHYAWSGLMYRQELEKYDRKIREDMLSAPLPLRWVLEQFLSRVRGPKFGFHLQTPLYLCKTILHISLITLLVSWCNFVVKNRITGSYCMIVSGLTKVFTVFTFILYTFNLPRKVIIGYQELYLDYSSNLWVLAGLGCLNIVSGFFLIVIEKHWNTLTTLLFYEPKPQFVEAITANPCVTRRRLSGDSLTDNVTSPKHTAVRISTSNHISNSDITTDKHDYQDLVKLRKHFVEDTYVAFNRTLDEVFIRHSGPGRAPRTLEDEVFIHHTGPVRAPRTLEDTGPGRAPRTLEDEVFIHHTGRKTLEDGPIPCVHHLNKSRVNSVPDGCAQASDKSEQRSCPSRNSLSDTCSSNQSTGYRSRDLLSSNQSTGYRSRDSQRTLYDVSSIPATQCSDSGHYPGTQCSHFAQYQGTQCSDCNSTRVSAGSLTSILSLDDMSDLTVSTSANVPVISFTGHVTRSPPIRAQDTGHVTPSDMSDLTVSTSANVPIISFDDSGIQSIRRLSEYSRKYGKNNNTFSMEEV